jgi:hypothetical protein
MIQNINGWPGTKSHPFQGMIRKRSAPITSSINNGPVCPERFQNYYNLRPLSDPSLSFPSIIGKDFLLRRCHNSLDYDEIMTNIIIEVQIKENE